MLCPRLPDSRAANPCGADDPPGNQLISPAAGYLPSESTVIFGNARGISLIYKAFVRAVQTTIQGTCLASR
jgi:hypothetical protein